MSDSLPDRVTRLEEGAKYLAIDVAGLKNDRRWLVIMVITSVLAQILNLVIVK